MADYIRKFRTSSGDKQIDFEYLGNKPSTHTHNNKAILDGTTASFTGHQDISGKENAGKITIGGTVYTASKHTITIGMSDGTTTTINFVGVS